jgi:hypothetical protein
VETQQHRHPRAAADEADNLHGREASADRRDNAATFDGVKRCLALVAVLGLSGCITANVRYKPKWTTSTKVIGGIIGDGAITAVANVAQAQVGDDRMHTNEFWTIGGVLLAVDLAAAITVYYLREHR